MKKKDYLIAVVLGFFTGIFAHFIFKHINLEVPGGIISLLAGIPVLWVLGLKLAEILSSRFSWTKQFAKFVVVGFLNASVDFGILNLLSYKTGIYSGKFIILFNIIAFVIAVSSSYFWNKYWTFRSDEKPQVSEITKFLGVNIIGTVINTSIVYSITTFAGFVNGFNPAEVENIAKVIATAVSLVWNFAGLKFLVFKK